MFIIIKKKIFSLIKIIGFYFNFSNEFHLSPISIHYKKSIEESYEYFKNYFNQTLLFTDINEIREYAIEQAINNSSKDDLFIEFGVYKGDSINLFAKKLTKYNSNIYGFDSFLGLEEDWKGSFGYPKGSLSLEGKEPKVESNVILVKGRVEESLNSFINKKNENKIIFAHLDLDTYNSTKYVLNFIKPKLKKNSIIIFDELYGYPGWKENEFKALSEEFSAKDFDYIAFGKRQAVIKIK